MVHPNLKKRHGKNRPKAGAVPRRKYSKVTGEGVNIDRLFVTGRIEVDTYLRYLREYELQTRRGSGYVAVGEMRKGRLDYAMTRQRDYFVKPVNDRLIEPTSPENMELVEDFLGDPPDYRSVLIRERVDDPMGDLHAALFGPDGERETWTIVGRTSGNAEVDEQEPLLDRYVRALEDG